MKIGIITHYYNSPNLGGILQAYALQYTIEKYGTESRQISYDFRNAGRLKKRTPIENIKRLLRAPITIFNIAFNLYSSKKKMKSCTYSEDLKYNKAFQKSFVNFRDKIIKHTDEVYKALTIVECSDTFDVYVTGSDQVWNLKWFHPAFFLDFVSPGKKKVSYAASISMDELSEKQREIFRHYLEDFSAVSVREESAVDLIKDLSPVEPVWVLDPTLLLSASEWDEVCAERVIDEPYLLCYFLGNNPEERRHAREMADRNGWKVVTLPYMFPEQYEIDRNFGDYRLADVGPEKFLSLIKHAEYVFTDSFHAVVFSHIYKRQFFVFNRTKSGEMSSRIYSITKLFGVEARFCDTADKEKMDYILSCDKIDYSVTPEAFEERLAISRRFIEENILR